MTHLIKAVTFDLWNTLIVEKNYTELRIETFRKALLGQGISRTPEEVMKAHEAATARYNKAWAEEHRHLPNEERLNFSLELLGAELPNNVKAYVSREFAEAFLRDPPELNYGVEETVRSLSAKMRLGIISDTGFTPGSVIKRYLAEKGLLSFFSAMVFSDELGYCKPDVRAFRKALGLLGVKPAEAVHVGDLLRTDMAGAETVGMRTVWLKFRDEEKIEGVTPDYVIMSLPQLLKIEGLYT